MEDVEENGDRTLEYDLSHAGGTRQAEVSG
jgi:hypothetical protein